MKTGTMMKLLLLPLFLLKIISTEAQQLKTCGPYTINKDLFKKALDYENANTGNFAPATPIVLRVFFHICEPTQGVLIDINEDQINLEFKHLVGAYAAGNICLINAGYDRIYSTALDTFNFSKDNSNIFLPYGIQNCLSIFYITQLGGTNNSSGGGASGITFGPLPTAWTIVQKSFIGKGVLEHEVGHCFGLLHTFDSQSGYGLEDIDGSNGALSADLISDTKADPYVFKYEKPTIPPCFSGSCSTYTGTCIDPKGRSDYSPPFNNLMSYWCGYFYPTGKLTTGQYTRVNSFLKTAAVLQVCESPTTVVQSSTTINSGFLMNSAITTLTTSGAVNINGTTNALLGAGQTVFLEPGFHATPTGTGRIFIRHSFCDTISNGNTSPVITAQDTRRQNIVSTSGEYKQTRLVAYPNPASTFVNLSFTLEKSETKASIELYDFNSRLMKQVQINNLPAGKNTETLSLENIPAGVYMVVVKFSNSFMQTKVVLIK